MNATLTPAARAASLFAGAFNSVFEDDAKMYIRLRTADESWSVRGMFQSGEMDFAPADVSAFLQALTAVIADNRPAVVAVSVHDHYDDVHGMGYAWNLADGAVLDAETAAPLFLETIEMRGAAEPWMTLQGMANPTLEGMEDTALTDEVKYVIATHGAPVILSVDGTVTIRMNAGDADGAREALEEIEFEDFDVEIPTCDGHVIGYVTVDDAESAELADDDTVPGTVTLSAPGTITVRMNAATPSAARTALQTLALKDFTAAFTTRDDHVITRITLGDADSAELHALGDISADELPHEIVTL
ncbi:hypothetical protein [Streptomyces griseomycini]|uniref:Uncharacterized protein n=1 Tax=Streptomyces griseomycini TaxID=66895 RepID=A0A7W7PWH5_9ACTN|nr:hypothetical protein [Streptomyces griseomycini]MBB4902587.1 hypothetical protein [Streptomyces griseomycini]GGR54325.1 hypothetical protein GCM10015536_69580 [Streptomyces griseomycini]